jgi:hypothetical protein
MAAIVDTYRMIPTSMYRYKTFTHEVIRIEE